MAKIDRPTIVAGNDTTLYIQLKEYRDGEYVDFDLDQVSDLKVELLCARDNYRYEIPYKIDTTYKNLIICDLKYTYYHTNTSYGIIVTGTNPDEKHWTWCMMPREGFLVVSNTSGLHLTDEAQQLSFNGLVGWGIKTEADLTNYYTKIEVNDLLEAKADTADLATVATTGDYNDLTNKPDLSQYATTSDLNLKQDVLISGENIKTINNQSLLGSGNIDIQGGGGESYTAGNNINITNNVISTTNDIDAGTITAGDFKIKHTESGTVHYTRWTDTANRYLAGQAMHGNELRIGEQWYTYGNNATLYVDTQNDGVITIPYTEWTYTDDIPSWMPGYITAAYYSATTVNGYPVYGAYNPDSDSPDFYIYDADNYGINSMWVDYVDIPSEKPLTYWKVKGKGMYVDIDNTTNVTFGDGDRQISIGTNNTFGYAGNVVMIGNGLTGEYMTEQLIVGRYNKEKNALFAVGNGHADSTFYSYSRTIDNDYTCTVWTELHEEFFNENGDVEIRVIKNDPEWTVLFECRPWLSISHLNDSNPYSENIEVDYQGTTYYGIATMQRDGNNLGVTFELYTDEQHTVPYNIFASPAEVDMSFVWFPISYKRDAFFVAEDGQIYIPHYEDINRTFNLGEAIFNLQQRPQPVQSDWNEGDATSLAYIQNKPTITQPVQSDWNEGDSSSLSYIQNKPTITQPVQSDWNEGDSSSLSYIQNKPDLSTKQDTLVSGTNIKTINNTSLLGSGNVDIQGAYYVDVTSILMGHGTDAMWNEFAAAVQANRPIVTNLMGIYYTCDSVFYRNTNECIVSAGDHDAHYTYTITRNGVDDLTVTYTNDPWNNKVSTFNGQTGDVTYTAPVTSVNGMTGAVTIQTGGGYKPYEERYLTFEAIQSGTFTFSTNDLQYSLDDGATWATLTAGTASPTVTAGNKILWKQTGLTPTSNSGIGTFSATGKFDASGNIMSLLFGDNFIGQKDLTGKNYAFRGLFNSNTKLINAENIILPATTLASSCYYNMFKSCTALTTAPELPATRLAASCYDSMLYGCTALTTAPELPATRLAASCYYSMFYGCTSLNYIKCLATDISAYYCTTTWVQNVAATGIFITPNNPPAWSRGISGIPTGWNSYTEAQYEVVRHYELSNVVTSTTAGVKIEVVSAMPATPDTNTLYLVV